MSRDRPQVAESPQEAATGNDNLRADRATTNSHNQNEARSILPAQAPTEGSLFGPCPGCGKAGCFTGCVALHKQVARKWDFPFSPGSVEGSRQWLRWGPEIGADYEVREAAHRSWEEANQIRQQQRINDIAADEYLKLRGRDVARRKFNAEQMHAAASERKLRLLDGWEFMDEDEGDDIPVWGTQETPVWAVGEPLMIFGPNGVGKSTLSHQLVFARIGLIKQVLGMPVLASPGKVFYVAADRPKQIKRAMRRLRKPEHREIIKERLVIHKGPLPFDVTIDKDALADLAQSHGATTIFIDSLKDVCSKPSNEESANGYNTARQEAIARGIEWVEDHHNRKASDDNKTPNTIEDVYGSRWLTAGAGSVICLWGEAGSTSVKLTQLKSPGGFLQPQDLTINHATGEMGAHVALGIMDVIRNGGKEGITVADAARFWTGKDKPTKTEMEGARGKLNRLVKQGTAMTYEHKADKLTRYFLSPVAAPQLKVSTGYQQDGLGPGW
ncbi:AAA family ATPase [Micromonospora sp. NPDC023814]|uniref:AAA family ATPase n=1 Tax=Micromonospora sp. NPDC023814 TaxID=3154596 RepID=UPI0033FFCC7E